MFHMQERQLLLSPLFKKSVHNAIRHFSCFSFLQNISKTIKARALKLDE